MKDARCATTGKHRLQGLWVGVRAGFLKKENWERETRQQDKGVSGADAGVVTRDQGTNWHINVKIHLQEQSSRDPGMAQLGGLQSSGLPCVLQTQPLLTSGVRQAASQGSLQTQSVTQNTRQTPLSHTSLFLTVSTHYRNLLELRGSVSATPTPRLSS